MPKRILLIGGPSTGKTTLLKHLEQLGYPCLEEISRHVISQAQKEGIDQLFLEKPLLFSELLRDARIEQHKDVDTYITDTVFIDRGIPDTVAYMDFIGQEYPEAFVQACKTYTYDIVFILPTWEKIHKVDQERYETFEQAQKIEKHLVKTYQNYGYTPIVVPMSPVEDRAAFILKTLALE
ncbi:AAA family ATPase [Dokdonia sp. Asnod3-C12]|uniref:AAA family ATPase n=1 Tax=Dokdonia sp. Asnod3-C12 TaxID=3160575 RepID=UPI00386FF30D